MNIETPLKNANETPLPSKPIAVSSTETNITPNNNNHDVSAELTHGTAADAQVTAARQVTAVAPTTHTSSNNNSSQKHGKWSKEEDDLLQRSIERYGEKQWRKISEHIPGRSAIQCLHRWTKILKPGLVKGPWTPEEDQRLVEWVQREGPTKWAQAASFIKGRNGKQCRERWYNNLNPHLKKGAWGDEEDEAIFKYYKEYGSSWSKIARALPGRTENSIKNRFYSTLRKIAANKKKAFPGCEQIMKDEGIKMEPLPTKEETKVAVEITPAPVQDHTPNTHSHDPLTNDNGGPLGSLAANHLYKLLSEQEFELKKRVPGNTRDGKDGDKRRSKNKRRVRSTAESFPIESKGDIIKEEHGMETNSVRRVTDAAHSDSSTKLSKSEALAGQALAAYNAHRAAKERKTPENHRILPPADSQPTTAEKTDMKRRQSLENASLHHASIDQKMVLLLDKLETLENMLYSTRKELLKLELSMTDEEIKSIKTVFAKQKAEAAGRSRPSDSMGNSTPMGHKEDSGKGHGATRSIDFLAEAMEEPRKALKVEEDNHHNTDLHSRILNLCDDYLNYS